MFCFLRKYLKKPKPRIPIENTSVRGIDKGLNGGTDAFL